MRYTAEQHAWMAENWAALTNAECAKAFNAKFGTSITPCAANGYGTNRKWHKLLGVREQAIRRSKGYDKYTTEWQEWFKRFAPYHTWRETAAESESAFGLPLTKSTVGNWMHKFELRSKIPNAGCFKKGDEPANKGKTWNEMGISPEAQAKSRATCFKKGNIPHNAIDKPVGYERVNRDGYIEIKVKDGLQGLANENFRFKHYVVWEQANGCSVPPNTMIVFADGDKNNLAPENLVAVPRTLWATISRDKIPYYDAESLNVAMNIARLKSAIRVAACHERECRKCGKRFKARYPHQKTCDTCLGRGVDMTGGHKEYE